MTAEQQDGQNNIGREQITRIAIDRRARNRQDLGDPSKSEQDFPEVERAHWKRIHTSSTPVSTEELDEMLNKFYAILQEDRSGHKLSPAQAKYVIGVATGLAYSHGENGIDSKDVLEMHLANTEASLILNNSGYLDFGGSLEPEMKLGELMGYRYALGREEDITQDIPLMPDYVR